MPDVRDKVGWEQLVTLLDAVEQSDRCFLIETFRRVLMALVRRLAAQTFEYAIPQRVSLPDLCGMLDEFLSTPSGGLRPLAIATALLRTIGKAFTLFDRVEAQGINEADAAYRSSG